MARGKRHTKRRNVKNIRKRRGTKRQRTRRTRRTRSQKGGEYTIMNVDTNPNEMNEEENILARQMRIIDI